MDVTAYAKAIVSAWRSGLIGTSAAFEIWLEESTDQVTWTDCTEGPTFPEDPASGEETYQVTLKKRWFRIRIKLTGTNVVATCWAVGFLEERES